MVSDPHIPVENGLSEKLATSGLRLTPQRLNVYEALLVKRDHPTAEEVFIRTKQAHPDISMATVYNCLDAMVNCGLVKAVHLSRGATRYCPNMREHCHFYCTTCGKLFDVDPPRIGKSNALSIPEGFIVDHYDIAIHGKCSSCATAKAPPNTADQA